MKNLYGNIGQNIHEIGYDQQHFGVNKRKAVIQVHGMTLGQIRIQIDKDYGCSKAVQGKEKTDGRTYLSSFHNNYFACFRYNIFRISN